MKASLLLILAFAADGRCGSYRASVASHPAFQRPVSASAVSAFQSFAKLSGRITAPGLVELLKLDPTRPDELLALTPFLSSLTEHDARAMKLGDRLYPAAFEHLQHALAAKRRAAGDEAIQALESLRPALERVIDPSDRLAVRKEAIALEDVRRLAGALAAYGGKARSTRDAMLSREHDMRRYSSMLRAEEDAQSLTRGKTVLITGASSGIGLAAAREFAAKGYRVALMARRADKLEELGGRLRRAGAEVLVVPGDVTIESSASRAVDAVIGAWGRLDVLVNNAGVMQLGPFVKQGRDVHEKIMGTNYFGTINMLRPALEFMSERGAGHVINVASIAGVVGVPYMASYNASKFALVGLTEALRREYYKTGITFTSFLPGLTDTPMGRAGFRDPSRLEKERHKTPREVAAKIVEAAERRPLEVFFGETPGLLAKLTKFIPRLTDWMMHRSLRRYKSDLAG